MTDKIPAITPYQKALNAYNPNVYSAHKKITAEEWNALMLSLFAQGNRQEHYIQLIINEHLTEFVETINAVIDSIPLAINAHNIEDTDPHNAVLNPIRNRLTATEGMANSTKTLAERLETKQGSDNIESVASDISKAILALKALIDGTYKKSQIYNKTEIDTQQAEQDDRLMSLETKQGGASIADIAPDISNAIISLNEDIDSLQLGVVPRAVRGIIEYDTNYGALTEELKDALTDKVLTLTGREPNNTDAVQVLDIGEPDKNIMYTYYYWASDINENVPSELNGWYLAYSALSQTINNEPCYTLNFNASAWEIGDDGYYHIIRTSEDHELGIDNTIDVELLKQTDGAYAPIKQFTVLATGTVDVYTDELFSGTLLIRTGKGFRVPTLVVRQSQIDGLEDDLQALENLIHYDKIIRTQAEFDVLIASPTWLGAVSVAFIGQFTLSTANNRGIKIPATVKQIHGFNSAKITITNFLYNFNTAKGGLWYDTAPTTPDYSIRDLEVYCTGTGTGTGYTGLGFSGCTNLTNCAGTGTGTGTSNGYGFRDCTNLTNCTGTGTGILIGLGFSGCTNLTNCAGTGTVTGTGASNGYGFSNITTASNCRDGGSSTSMWSGTNKNINLETCRKTPVTANNTTLNT